MSLFKAREWWSTNCGCEEFHDFGCLCVANIDNRPTGHDKVIVGSFQGYIRVYEPHPPVFSPGHVILEKQLGHPVIQVAAGKFIQGSSLLQLAILHPHLLSVYSVAMDTINEPEPTYNLLLNCSHNLKRTACNMTWGNFGKMRDGGDLMCVQSMDGQLSFFHHESAMFTCFLPEFLLPGPLSYIQQTDSVVTMNSAHVLQVFKYQSLSVAGVTSEQHSGAEHHPGAALSTSHGTSPNTGKKISPDWTVNLGEQGLQIQVVSVATSPSLILVLGERSLSCLTQNGVVCFTKKLDFNPSCLFAYYAAADGRDGTAVVRSLVASHSNQLLVLKDSTLIWTASMAFTPVHLVTAQFQEHKGIIVGLGEEGKLTCSYLGTDPTVFTASPSTRRDVSFEEMEKELNRLNSLIKDTAKDGAIVSRVDIQRLKLRAEVQPDQVRLLELDEARDEEEAEEGSHNLVKKCVEVKVRVESGSGPSLRDVVISVTASLPLTTHPSHFVIPEVSSAQRSQALVVTVVCTPSLLPTNTSLQLSATYRASDGTQQVVEHQVKLPLHLFCEPVYPEKATTFKVTVDASPCESTLSKLFPSELVMSEAPPQAVGVRYLCGPVVTVVASKGTHRYRLQSNSLSALGTTLCWLLDTLEKYFESQHLSFSAKCSPPLPLNEYFEIVDRHFKLRKNLEQCREWLGRHAHQLRSVQKRLLTRFKDKTPVGLAHLDTLLDGTYMQLMALSDKNELLELELQECSNQLSCATVLINTLLRLCSDMGNEDFSILNSTLSPVVVSDAGQGWEELVDAAVTHLLRTSLAKSSKDQHSSFPSLDMPADVQKLKKHIALLCDRICKGFLPSGAKAKEATQSLNGGTASDTTAPIGFTASPDKAPIGRRTSELTRPPTMPALTEQSSEETLT